MAREFKSANRHEIQDIIAAYPFSRRITEVHLHHTWRPRQCDYRGLATIEGMWRYHTENNGWSDIGQHITVAPDGAIWLCRNFNWAPASARGFNGNRSAGPFMIEMIGDFDVDQEQLTDEQRQATLAVIKSVQSKFELEPGAIRFHNEMSPKSCPGTATQKADWIRRIECFTLETQRPGSRSMPFPSRYTRAYELMRGMNPDAEQSDDMSDAEHDDEHAIDATITRGSRGTQTELTVDVLESLAGHVINIERGRFSDSGRLETSESDIDRLFDELLPSEVATAMEENRKAHLVFYAHGGLVSESNALLGASKQLPFWRANGVYPVFFIWETGVAETIRQLVQAAVTRSQPPTTRGVTDWLTDRVSDPIIEKLARASGGGLLWSGMKSSARSASAPGMAANHVAEKAAEFFDEHGEDIHCHVIGHSAGSVFHTHFLPQLLDKGVPVRSAHYLAPAVRNDLFLQKVAPHLGQGLGPLTVYTMNKQREKADNVASAYHKSLLYLVSRAFEDERDTEILGLEESLRGNRQTRALFGLDGNDAELADVIWSPTPESRSGNASAAISHGAFDDDPATMESVLRRMLDLRDGQSIEPFPRQSSRGTLDDLWRDQFDWPESLKYLSDLTQSGSGINPAQAHSHGSAQSDGQPLSDNVIASQAAHAEGGAASSAGDKGEFPDEDEDEDEDEDTRKGKNKDDVKAGKKGKKDKKDKKGKKDKKDRKSPQKKSGKSGKSSADDSEGSAGPDRGKQTPNRKKQEDLADQSRPQGTGSITGGGSRRALCIGIDHYQRSPLNGCVADARLWSETLSRLGYQIERLENREATASNIRERVQALVDSSCPGDELVLQFAGHGTQFMDFDGDETGGDTPARDECLCAVDCDFSNDGLVIDDELRMIISRLPGGVSMTCFFDCCHSGSATRAVLNMADAAGGKDVRARFLIPNEQMENVYYKRIRKLRKQISRSVSVQRDVLFSACRSSELAYESDGQGDFTRRATQIISRGVDGISNTDFLEQVLRAFGSSPRQNPELHCDIGARSMRFLSPVSGNNSEGVGANMASPADPDLEQV